MEHTTRVQRIRKISFNVTSKPLVNIGHEHQLVWWSIRFGYFIQHLPQSTNKSIPLVLVFNVTRKRLVRIIRYHRKLWGQKCTLVMIQKKNQRSTTGKITFYARSISNIESYKLTVFTLKRNEANPVRLQYLLLVLDRYRKLVQVDGKQEKWTYISLDGHNI